MPSCSCRPAASPRCPGQPAALPRRPDQPSALPRRPSQQHLPDSSSLQRPCRQHLPGGSPPQCRHPLRHGTPGQQFRCSTPASSISGTAPPPATSSRWRFATAPRPGRNLIGPPGQQQTSSGGEKYSGLASNLAHLGRIC